MNRTLITLCVLFIAFVVVFCHRGGHGHGHGHGRWRKRRCETPRVFECNFNKTGGHGGRRGGHGHGGLGGHNGHGRFNRTGERYYFNSTTHECVKVPEGHCVSRFAKFRSLEFCQSRCANKTQEALAVDTEMYEEVNGTEIPDSAEIVSEVVTETVVVTVVET